jgi:hypothetical protein
VLHRFTWQVTAEGTTDCYRALLDRPVATRSTDNGEWGE